MTSDIWVTTRETIHDAWGPPVNLGSTVNSSFHDDVSNISADGLILFFGSTRSGGYGGYDIWITTRATLDDPLGTPMNLGPIINSPYLDTAPSISADGSSADGKHYLGTEDMN